MKSLPKSIQNLPDDTNARRSGHRALWVLADESLIVFVLRNLFKVPRKFNVKQALNCTSNKQSKPSTY